MAGSKLDIADYIFKNGAIYTVDSRRSWAQAVAVKDFKIVYVGDDRGVDAFSGRQTEVIDLQGKMMLPGFHDVHVHLFEGGMHSLKCDLWDCQSPPDVVDRIKQYIESQSRDATGWIQCFGLQKTFADDISRDLLDALSPDRPVFILTFDGHSCRVNSKALEMAGIDKNSLNPPQGDIERLPGSKEPSGYLHDFAVEMVRETIPPASLEEQISGLENGIRKAHRFGITSIIEPGADDNLMLPYLELNRRNALPLRVRASISPINWQPGAFGDEIYDFVAARDKYRRSGIDVESVKMYIDGVLENGSAVLLEPYASDRFKDSQPFYSQEDLNRYITWIDSQDLQVHLHAIGDGGVRMALDAFEAARRINGMKDNRHHICHVQMIDPVDVPRFAELGVAANFQAVWGFPDPYVTQSGLAAVGQERLKKFYVIGSVHRSGGMIACGSDWFVSSLNPLDAIEVGIRRQDPNLPEGAPALNPQEAVDLATMIQGYTINGAYLMHQDQDVGSIETGKQADLIVLDRNLFETPATEVNQAEVLLTVFNGQIVYGGKF